MLKLMLGIGSNVGDRVANLQMAIDGIKEFAEDLRISTVYESAALLPENAPAEWDMAYLNMNVMGECSLPPHNVLKRVKQLESDIGRVKRGHWSPREIDIDILAYGEKLHSSDDLQIPHLHLLDRDFALMPFAELWPDWKCPREGKYSCWAAKDIIADKGFCLNESLKQLEIMLSV